MRSLEKELSKYKDNETGLISMQTYNEVVANLKKLEASYETKRKEVIAWKSHVGFL